MLELRKRADKTGPEPPAGEPWPLAGVELVGEAPKSHNFADTFVARAMQDGYLEFEEMSIAATEGYGRNPVVTGTAIVLHLAGGDLIYEVGEHPGRYDDAGEPSGKRVTHEYRCKLRKG